MKYKISLLLTALLFSSSAFADLKNTAVIRLLDKVTAVSSTIEVKVGETLAYHSLDISIERCDKTPPEDKPEAGAFIEIKEVKKDTLSVIFRGWMFASNPSINSLEHAVYDVWLVDCK